MKTIKGLIYSLLCSFGLHDWHTVSTGWDGYNWNHITQCFSCQKIK